MHVIVSLDLYWFESFRIHEKLLYFPAIFPLIVTLCHYVIIITMTLSIQWMTYPKSKDIEKRKKNQAKTKQWNFDLKLNIWSRNWMFVKIWIGPDRPNGTQCSVQIGPNRPCGTEMVKSGVYSCYDRLSQIDICVFCYSML
jgi:hypothetical protein